MRLLKVKLFSDVAMKPPKLNAPPAGAAEAPNIACRECPLFRSGKLTACRRGVRAHQTCTNDRFLGDLAMGLETVWCRPSPRGTPVHRFEPAAPRAHAQLCLTPSVRTLQLHELQFRVWRAGGAVGGVVCGAGASATRVALPAGGATSACRRRRRRRVRMPDDDDRGRRVRTRRGGCSARAAPCRRGRIRGRYTRSPACVARTVLYL